MAVSDSEYKKMLASGESAGKQSTNNPIYKDQYQPMPAPLFVEETPEQEPEPEELPDQDWTAQKTDEL